MRPDGPSRSASARVKAPVPEPRSAHTPPGETPRLKSRTWSWCCTRSVVGTERAPVGHREALAVVDDLAGTDRQQRLEAPVAEHAALATVPVAELALLQAQDRDVRLGALCERAQLRMPDQARRLRCRAADHVRQRQA